MTWYCAPRKLATSSPSRQAHQDTWLAVGTPRHRNRRYSRDTIAPRANNLMAYEASRKGLADETSMAALAQDATVWASQHGLVSLTSCMYQRVINF